MQPSVRYHVIQNLQADFDTKLSILLPPPPPPPHTHTHTHTLQSPSVYSSYRRKALEFTFSCLAESLGRQAAESEPLFLYGDFNFRLDFSAVVKVCHTRLYVARFSCFVLYNYTSTISYCCPRNINRLACFPRIICSRVGSGALFSSLCWKSVASLSVCLSKNVTVSSPPHNPGLHMYINTCTRVDVHQY